MASENVRFWELRSRIATSWIGAQSGHPNGDRLHSDCLHRHYSLPNKGQDFFWHTRRSDGHSDVFAAKDRLPVFDLGNDHFIGGQGKFSHAPIVELPIRGASQQFDPVGDG